MFCFFVLVFATTKNYNKTVYYLQDSVIMFVHMILFLKLDVIEMKAKCLGLNLFMK